MSNTFSPTEYRIISVHQTPWVFVAYLAILLACGLVMLGGMGNVAFGLAVLIGIGVVSYVCRSPVRGKHALPRWRPALPILVGSLILMFVVGLPGWLVIAAACVGPLIRFATWRRRTYTLTNERLICRHGLFIQVEEVYWLNRLQRYTERSSWLGLHLGGFADLEIHATGGSVTLRQIHRFIAFQNALLSLV
jgi:hypothetical protein